MKTPITFLIGALIALYFDEVYASNRLEFIERSQAQCLQDSYFECNVKLIHGMSLKEDLPPAYTCNVEEHGNKSYLLIGDKIDTFFEGKDVSLGIVIINVPYSAIGGNNDQDVQSTISINEENSKFITITYDRRRKLQSSGNKKVLVVRISDDSSADAERKIAQSSKKMYRDVFGDNNNLKTVYRNCSGGQMNIIPATGSGVKRGVITIPPPKNVCTMTYLDVGNHAKLSINNLGIDSTLVMMVMPNCVNFGRGEAWGDMNGQYTFYKSEHASFPMVQVHEIGHNLGMGHSNGENGKAYADGTCYMGARVPWDDEGAKMCFNAAKMWYFGWFSKFHATNRPEQWGLSRNLIGIAEAKNRGHLVSDEKIVIRVQTLHSTQTSLFVMYNYKKGPNSGVVEDGNKIIVTEQGNRISESIRKAALGTGQEYHQTDWAGNGSTLVIKNCGLQEGSWGKTKQLAVAHVIIYVKGKTYKSCETDDEQNDGECVDFPGFHDFYGEDYSCAWYGQADHLCKVYGAGPPNQDGITANQACCTCGGGNQS